MKKLFALLPLALAACASNNTNVASDTNRYADEYRVPSSSHWVTCKPNKKAKDNDYGDLQVEATASEFKYKSKGHKGGTAKRDHDFKDEDQYRYVDSKGDIFSSDADTAFFVDKDIIKGEKGKVGVSTQIICDGDACSHTLEWGNDGTFYCGED